MCVSAKLLAESSELSVTLGSHVVYITVLIIC